MGKLFVCLVTLIGLLSASAQAQHPGGHQCAPDGVAIGGYDLVSYHEPGGPVIGSAEFEAGHNGLRYRFASAANRERFHAAREKYLPRYSGFCAATLSMGRLACPDYTNFKIENGELLLFELAGFTNGRTLWNSDPSGFRQRADANALELIRQ